MEPPAKTALAHRAVPVATTAVGPEGTHLRSTPRSAQAAAEGPPTCAREALVSSIGSWLRQGAAAPVVRTPEATEAATPARMGHTTPPSGSSGGGGTQTAGGPNTFAQGTATDGTFGQGGSGGGSPSATNAAGGGGGGGWFGGGGSDEVLAPGGGGGSSFIDPLLNIQVNDRGGNVGNGSVAISWSSPSSK